MKLKKITIKGFRGFNTEETILFDDNITIVYGQNGSGKSSLTEALEWLFFDQISRQRLSRCKSEYQYEEYLKNVFYSESENPFVELTGTIRGIEYKLKKELISREYKLYINDLEVADFSSLALNLESYFRPMLAQTEIKALVDAEPKDRWEQISCILGQDTLSTSRDDLMALRNNKKTDEYKSSLRKYESLITELTEYPEFISLTQSLSSLNVAEFHLELSKILSISNHDIEAISAAISSKIKALLNSELGNRVTSISYPDRFKIDEFAEYIKTGFEGFASEAIKVSYGSYGKSELEFLNLGYVLGKSPVCPFCLEETYTEERKNSISKLLKDNEEIQIANSRLKTQTDEISLWLSNFEISCKTYLPNETELAAIAIKLKETGLEDLAIATQQLQTKVDTDTARLAQTLKESWESYRVYVEQKYFHKNTDVVLEINIDNLVNSIKQHFEDINSAWESLKEGIGKAISLEKDVDQNTFKKWFYIEKVSKFLNNSAEFITRHKLLLEIDLIQTDLEEFEKKEIETLLALHADEIKDYYHKLNPSDKVQFFGIETKENRRQASLKAEAYGKQVNPVTFFSEAHTNSLALSIYFPQRVDRNATWECVILDDPVQSMDDNHSQSLLEVLVEIQQRKQLIIMTHSKEFYLKLKGRFYSTKPAIYHFYNNDEKGPKIELIGYRDTERHLKVCKDMLLLGDITSLETAGGELRKAMESVCIEYLMYNSIPFNIAKNVQKNLGIKGLFDKANSVGLPDENTDKLRSILDISQQDSHAWSLANTNYNTISKGIDFVQDILDNHIA